MIRCRRGCLTYCSTVRDSSSLLLSSILVECECGSTAVSTCMASCTCIPTSYSYSCTHARTYARMHARTRQPATERAASSISSSTVIEYRSIVFDRRSDADVRERQRRRVHGRRGRIDLDRSRVSTARSLGPESELCTPRAGQQSSSTSKLKRVIVVVVVVPSSGAARLPLPLSGAYHASSRPELEFESELIGSPRTWRPRDLSGSVRKLSSERMASCTLRTSDDETSAAARCDAALCGSDAARTGAGRRCATATR